MNILKRLGFSPVRLTDRGLVVLDQRKLPIVEHYETLKSVEDTANAIANLTVRGAPLIGIVAAYGLCLLPDPENDHAFESAAQMLVSSRPTAVNLPWAVERMQSRRNEKNLDSPIKDIMLKEAHAIHDEDARMCAAIGMHGNEVVSDDCRILTHCNAGALATGGIGTALGVIYTAFFSGKKVEVWVDETRPMLQGARLTAWELARAKVPYTLIADNMAGRLMAEGRVDLVITGADRVAINLDMANKTGTYSLAALADYHHVPFYCAAPSSTFDPACSDGESIVIEYRKASELREIGETPLAPSRSEVYNPAFDITPHNLMTGIITEKGIISPS